MSPTQVAQEWFEQVWNQHDSSAIDRLLNPSTNVHGLNLNDATVLRGPAEFKVFHKAILSALPDTRITVTKTLEQGDWVAAHFVVTGTHTGDGLGMPASGKRVEFSGIAMGRIEKGQWVEGWNCVDFYTLTQQIGAPMRVG